MFLIRKIGSVFRGKATPRQVALASVLGGALGFVPGFFLPGDLGGGFLQAPGLLVLLVSLVLVLNANLGVFGLVTLVAKLLSLLLLPVSYAIGTWLLEGPLQGLFRGLINGKVSAWFGLEYYATSGGLVLGLGFGALSGFLMNRAIRSVRERMAAAETNSATYQKYASKGWVRVLTWILLGGNKGKQSWQELATQQKQGLPIRLSGVLVVVVGIASLWVFQQWFSTPILTRNLRAGLESVNGATVDVDQAQLDLQSAQLRVQNLAVADRNALGQDLFAADALVATVDTGELLRRRLVIDELRSTNARSGSARQAPGVLLPKPAEPPPPPPPAGTKTVEDYLKDLEVWKQRLAQVREWLDGVSGGDQPVTPPGERTPEQVEQQRSEQAAALGLARVVATHLLEGAPRLLIRKIDFEGIAITIDGQAERLDLRGRNLSTDPSLVPEAMALGFTTQSDKLKMQLTGATQAKPGLGFDFALRRVPVDAVFGQLKFGGAPPLRGGTMDLVSTGGCQGHGAAMAVELPLQVQLRDTTFALAGAKETKVDSLLLPIGVRGPLLRPSVALDDKALQDALVKAGQQELANFVQSQAGKLLGGTGIDLGGVVDPNKSVGENLDAARQKAEAEAKAKLEEEKRKAEEELKKKAADELKKRLPGGIRLPGGGI